jgi:hypothetical protein
VVTTTSEGTSFAQKGWPPRGAAYIDGNFNPAYWANHTCSRCQKRGHPPSHCTAPVPVARKAAATTDKDAAASKPTRSQQSNSKPPPTASNSDDNSVASLKKEVKVLTNLVLTTYAMSKKPREHDSDSDSDDSGAGNNFFQISGVPTGDPVLPLLADTSLSLRDVILLDSQSSIDVFCNRNLVTDVTYSPKKMHILGHGSAITARRTASIIGYNQKVWYCKKAATNILGLHNLTKQFRVTYDSDDQHFVVDRTPDGLPAMLISLHSCGFYYYTPPRRGAFYIWPARRHQNPRSGFGRFGHLSNYRSAHRVARCHPQISGSLSVFPCHCCPRQ